MSVDNLLVDNDFSTVWPRCLDFIKERIGRISFETWFQTTKLSSMNKSKAVIEVPNRFFADFIEEHYKSLILTSFETVYGTKPEIEFTANSQADWRIANEIVESQSVARPLVRENATIQQFNPNYTFQSFVVGDSNQFANAASMAVGEAPGKTSFNPLVIYGGTGLGKTHLLQAIGNFALTNETAQKVVYVTSEQFTNQFIQFVHINKNSSEFYKKYQDVEILLLDDVQFFSGKESTQEEFFRIFNTLYQMRCQIVITSDRPPQEIPDMTQRLLSRFSAGLITDIQPPNFETRMAILRQKTENDGVELPEEVITYVADHIKTNVRELEGTLVKLIAYGSFTGISVTIDTAKEVLGDSIEKEPTRITLDKIQKVTAEALGLSTNILRTHTRKKEVAIGRQVAMYFAKKHTSHSLKSIGLALGGRDYSTVIHACKKIEGMLKEDIAFAGKLDQIEQSILAH